LFGNIVDGEMRLSDMGIVVQDTWNNIPLHFPDVVLREYVVMPNHVHGIIEIKNPPDDAITGAYVGVDGVVGDNVGAGVVGAENFQPLHDNTHATVDNVENVTDVNVGTNVVNGDIVGADVVGAENFQPLRDNARAAVDNVENVTDANVEANVVDGDIVVIGNVGAENFQPLRDNAHAAVDNVEPKPQHKRNEFQHVIPRSIGSIIRGFKIGTTKQIGYSIWQRNYYERVIRDYKEYLYMAKYIKNNPIMWIEDRFYRMD
jgi:REP element-mobilizing transposase RayT